MEGRRTRDLVALILESFRIDDVASLCESHDVPLSQLSYLREAFIDAGSRRVHALARQRYWIQVNVNLDPAGLQWALFVADAQFQTWIETGLGAQRIDHFSFVCKPPGLRLRFSGRDDGFTRELESVLRDLVARGAIDGWTFGPYDPEVYQFGGEEGLHAAHDFFTIESTAVLDYYRLMMAADARLEPEIFSLVLLDALLRQATDDVFELWDVWCKMGLAGRSLELDGGERERLANGVEAACDVLRPLLAEPAQLARMASPAEYELLKRYRIRLTSVVEELRRLVLEGRLLWGLREILPFWVIFHWNRMRFPLEQQARLTFIMTHLLCPKR